MEDIKEHIQSTSVKQGEEVSSGPYPLGLSCGPFFGPHYGPTNCVSCLPLLVFSQTGPWCSEPLNMDGQTQATANSLDWPSKGGLLPFLCWPASTTQVETLLTLHPDKGRPRFMSMQLANGGDGVLWILVNVARSKLFLDRLALLNCLVQYSGVGFGDGMYVVLGFLLLGFCPVHRGSTTSHSRGVGSAGGQMAQVGPFPILRITQHPSFLVNSILRQKVARVDHPVDLVLGRGRTGSYTGLCLFGCVTILQPCLLP